MKAATYPKFRACQWLDTSPKAMRRKQATILYGVQTQREKGGKWMHCHKNGEPMIFNTQDECSAAIDELWVASRATSPTQSTLLAQDEREHRRGE